MSSLDISFIVIYFVILITAGFYLKKRSQKNIEGYFLSDRKLPWWLAGMSMAATTFAADTPLAVTGIVSKSGIAGNWLWFSFVFSGIMTVFFFAPYWRRSEVMTDAEFAEIRYGGRPAEFLRAFRAVYLAVPINIIIMGWVTIGMSKVIEAAFGWPKWQVILILYLITCVYIIFSGLWGVIIADFFQFITAMAGSIVLMVYALDSVNGIDGLKEKLVLEFGQNHGLLSLSPFLNAKIAFSTALVWISMQWWVSWYPGAEPGGGGYVGQRIYAAKDEKNAVYSTLFFNLLHYGVRPWPWIITALVAMVTFNNLSDPEMGYPMAMKKFLPSGFFGLLAIAFFSAFMSTISTHLNWGASYIVNDFYKRFIRKNEKENHYVLISRVTVFILMILALITSYFFDSVKESWELLLSIGAGTGLVYLLRWYWHRVNAYSEISAMIAAFFGSIFLRIAGITDFALLIIINTLITTFVWVAVTYMTKPEDETLLKKFVEKIKPEGPGWKNFQTKEQSSLKPLFNKFYLWAAGCIFVLSFLFGMGKFIFKEYTDAFIFLMLLLFSGFIINKKMKQLKLF
ncbi:MAG: Na+:solute symporter [Spirochaetia bacterium]|nr:Na+:solute symporter [Spirochaetia bacterium]